MAGSGVGCGGLCLGQGLLMWAFRLLRRASTSEVLGGELSRGQRRRRHGILKVSTREPASLGLGGGLGPEDRLHGGPCGPWSREVAFSLRSGHTGGGTFPSRDAQSRPAPPAPVGLQAPCSSSGLGPGVPGALPWPPACRLTLFEGGQGPGPWAGSPPDPSHPRWCLSALLPAAPSQPRREAARPVLSQVRPAGAGCIGPGVAAGTGCLWGRASMHRCVQLSTLPTPAPGRALWAPALPRTGPVHGKTTCVLGQIRPLSVGSLQFVLRHLLNIPSEGFLSQLGWAGQPGLVEATLQGSEPPHSPGPGQARLLCLAALPRAGLPPSARR